MVNISGGASCTRSTAPGRRSAVRTSLPLGDNNVPFVRAIIKALSPCQVLAFEGFPTRADVHRSPVTRAARSAPMTSPAHRTCVVSRAGQHERIVPGTRSACSANRLHSMQHVELRTCAHMWNPVCRIQTTHAYILTVRATVSSKTRDFPALVSLHVDARARAVREMPNGPRRWCLAGSARLPK